MTTDTRLGTFEQIIALFPAASAELAKQTRALIERIHPDAYEVPRLGEKAATYGVGSSKMKEAYSYIMPREAYVNLGFCQGAHLPDPAGLLEGTGKAMRHVKIRSARDLERPELLDLLRTAMDERKRAGQGGRGAATG